MKYSLSAIVAVDDNNGIGKDGALLASVSKDLKNFRMLTSGKTVILGSKTLSTFPGGRPLKNRRNIILSRNENYKVDGAEVAHSEKELLSMLKGECFVIGGGQIYKMLVPYCDTVYMTKFRHSFDADTFFPNLSKEDGWFVSGVMDSFVSEETDGFPGMLCDILVYRRNKNEN